MKDRWDPYRPHPTDLIAERPDAPWISATARSEQRVQEIQGAALLALAKVVMQRDGWRALAVAGWLAAVLAVQVWALTS